jgi:hypothetical protein
MPLTMRGLSTASSGIAYPCRVNGIPKPCPLTISEKHFRILPLVRLELPRLSCRHDADDPIPRVLPELLQRLDTVHDVILARDLACTVGQTEVQMITVS